MYPICPAILTRNATLPYAHTVAHKNASFHHEFNVAKYDSFHCSSQDLHHCLNSLSVLFGHPLHDEGDGITTETLILDLFETFLPSVHQAIMQWEYVPLK